MEMLKVVKNEQTILKLSGELDMTNSNIIREKILEMNLKDLILDFENVTYIDSSGIGVLISLQKDTRYKGGSMRIINIENKLLKLLKMVGIDKLLQISEK